MAVLRIQGFSGNVPVSGDRALPDNFAVDSVNTWLYGGELRGIRPPSLLQTVNTTTRKVLRIPKRTVGGDPAFPGVIPPPSYLGDSVWKQFTDPYTDILRGQLIEDQYERYYFCSPTTGPMFNTYARMRDGLTDYKLGVPGPNPDEDVDGNNPDRPTIISIDPYNKSEDIYEVEFKIATLIGDTTSYANPGGTGDRTASIVQAGTVVFDTAGELLINGNKTAGFKMTNLSAKDKTITFDFGATKKIDEFKWYQKGSKDYEVWQFDGSNDNTTWTTLANVQLGGSSTATYAFTPTAVYRYYRLYQAAPTDPINLTRAYCYTWANEFGEESPPSLPVLGSGNSMGTWTIGNIKDPPAVAGYPAYTKKFLYRTVSGGSGQTTFYRVAEHVIGAAVPDGGWITQTTYADDSAELTDAQLVNKLTLESTSWDPPPADLQGWIAMPNGFLIGFRGSDIYMSEAYHWHAWPAEYKQAVETPIVGLGVIGQTCIVCTQGYPATVTGIKPATCSFTKATADEPCLSRGSIVSTPQGVVWVSQNGLVMVGPNGIQNVTQQLITRQEWLKDYAPQWIRAARYQNGYLALRMIPVTGGVQTAFYLDPSDLKVALTELSDFDVVRNLQNDFWSGEVFVIDDAGRINRWDPPTDNLMPVRWKSKEFQYAFEENFGAYAIYWDDARYSNYNYGTSIMPTTEKVRFKVYANRRVVYDQVVAKNGRPIRLPSGFKADVWQFEIRARAPVYTMHVASTMKELKGV